MNFFKLAIFLCWNILNTLTANTDYVETPVGCAVYEPDNTCATGMTCEPNCLSCTDHPFSCNICKQTYFLFTLPQDHSEIGLKAGAKICVQCPYQTYQDAYTLYCGDCIENGNNWDVTRKCTFDYFIKNLDETAGTYHIVQKPLKVLFYVVPISRVLNPESTEFFQTTSCEGGDHFCDAASQTCFSVASIYQYDLNNLYVQCADGYAFSQEIQGCDSCPSNCQSCNIYQNRMIDDQGRVSYNVKKVCLICNTGFALYKGYPKITDPTELDLTLTPDDMYPWCEACFSGCDECFYGNSELNLNSEQWNSELFNYMAPNIVVWDEQLAYILENFRIAQRCSVCTNPPNEPYIISMDLRTCIRCDSQCSTCEYTTYDPSITDPKEKYPTRNVFPIEPPQGLNGLFQPSQTDYDSLYSIYRKRCRLCQEPDYAFLAAGNDCFQCTIANCAICHKVNDPSQGGSPFSSFQTDFTPLDRESMAVENCLQCQPNFYLKLNDATKINDCVPNILGLPAALPPIAGIPAEQLLQGCTTYEFKSTKYQCRLCDNGYKLYLDTDGLWKCASTCQIELKDFFCLSCLQVDTTIRCQVCAEGFYVDMATGRCSQCHSSGNCKICIQYSLTSVYKPSYYTYVYDGDLITQGPICYECSDIKQQLNPYSKQCEQCGDSCQLCMTNAPIGYCGQCIAPVNSRSVTSDGQDCTLCPDLVVGCRDRSSSELILANKYFDISSPYIQYSHQSFKCDASSGPNPTYFDASIGRCMKCTSNTFCKKKISVTVEAFCHEDDTSANPHISIPSYFAVKTETQATILLKDIETADNYLAWNRDGVTMVIVNLVFQYKSTADHNRCLFSKDTILTTNILKNVFSVQDLELVISVNGAPAGNKLQLFISSTLYIEYFTSVTIQGVQIMPAINHIYVSGVADPFLQSQAFSISLTKNEGAKFSLKDVDIINFEARQYYLGLDLTQGVYTTPYSSTAILLKKYTPFNTQLLNVYDLQLENVLFGSVDYLIAADLPFQAFPLYLTYDSPIPYLNIKFTNVRFEDVCVENQALIDLKSTTMTSLPQWNSKVIFKQVNLKDMYIINQGALLSTKVTDKAQGIMILDTLVVDKVTFNSSRGLVNFQTMQSVKIRNFQLTNSFVNYTSIFYITTIDINQLYIYKSEFTFLGRVLETQQSAPLIKPNDYEYSSIKMSLFNMNFDTIYCKTINCLILIQSPKNIYELQLNVTIFGLNVRNIQSVGFDEALVEASTSAAIQISRVHQLKMEQINSINNANLTVIYSEEAKEISGDFITCSQTYNPSVRNNYCIFINNFYISAQIRNMQFLNLNGIDNSFLAISSWSNLVYNTSASGTDETVNLQFLSAQGCTITTTVLAVPSSIIVIDSSQTQKISISDLIFWNNYHYQSIKGTLRPSNPTLVIRSVIATLTLINSQWKNNFVQGYGAVLYLEAGTQFIDNITMTNSNHDPLHLDPIDPEYVPINGLAEGGHLLLQGYDITLQHSVFTNSSARVGGGIYFRALKEGKGYFNNISIRYGYTPLDGSAVSRGGCLFIDSFSSQLDMKLEGVSFQDCSVRADGGGIYLIASDKAQKLYILNSLINNCYGLAGTAISVYFESRTQEIQQTILEDVKIQGNYSNAVNYFASLKALTIIEQFLFIKRIAAFQQDYGQVIAQNSFSEGLYFFSMMSLKSPSYLLINNFENQHSTISYRPYIEIFEPLLNPITIEGVQFRNITSLSTNVSCTAETLTSESKAICLILQIRVDYGEVKINPAMMVIDQITKYTPLSLNNLFLNRVLCEECNQGLIQILRVARQELQELVILKSSRCSNSYASYYGCYTISSEAENSILESDQYLNYSYQSKLSSIAISSSTGLVNKISQIILVENTSIVNSSDFQYAIPNPTYKSHVVIKGLNVQEMNSVHGGALTIFGLTANVSEMYCTLVQVTGEGGCIFFESLPKKNGSIVYQRLNLYNSVFFRNNASIGGAVRVRESGISDPNKSQNTMIQNQAKLFGDDVAGYPTKMGIKIGGVLGLQSYLNENTGWLHYPIVIKSGQIMKAFEDQSVIILLMDDNDKQMNYQFTATSNISSSQINTIQGEPTRYFDTTAQGFNYSNLQILFDPYQNITLDIVLSSKIINIPRYYSQYPYQLLGFDVGYTLQARVRSVECQRGEAYNAQQGSCTPCPLKTYVLQFKGICKEINEDTMNSTSLDQISLKFGRWRPNHLNDKAELCKNQNINCKGGYDVGNDLCIEGMIGALCEQCDIYGAFWDQSYSNSAQYQCGTCGNRTTNIIMIVALSVWTMISTILSVKGNQERMENTILYDIIAIFGWSSSQKASANVAVLMKILTNHIQILSILQGFQISIPAGAVDSVNTVSMPAKTVGNSLDCFLVENTWGLDLIYFRLIWSLIMQIIYILAILLLMLIAVMIGKLQFKIQYVYTMFIFLFLLLQPNYIMEFMLLISSRSISGLLWIQANVSYRYDTFTHDQWIAGFGVPGLVTWVVILPLIFLYVLYQGAAQEKLDSYIFSQSWGFFYHEYRRTRYYWEFVKIFYRTLISILIVYFQEEIIVKGILSFLVVYAYYGLSNHFMPYQQRTINDLDAFSTVTLALSLIIGVFLFRTLEINLLGLTYAGYVVIAILNGLFFLIMFYILFQGYLKQFAPKLDEIRDKIREKFPELEYNPKFRPYLINHTKMNIKARKLWQMVSKIVNIGLKNWSQDKSKPLQFIRVQEREIIDYNTKLNEALKQFNNLSQSENQDHNGDQILLEDGDQHSINYNSQVNALAEEGKENYSYQ